MVVVIQRTSVRARSWTGVPLPAAQVWAASEPVVEEAEGDADAAGDGGGGVVR
ncbi:MAG TPA: hypothetical protein VMV92_34915 [Streptosporangiaceae bacterium]|nr:hypothetical protein [Streptosporangiaceae bacterium]